MWKYQSDEHCLKCNIVQVKEGQKKEDRTWETQLGEIVVAVFIYVL